MSIYDECIKLNKEIQTPGMVSEKSMPLANADYNLVSHSTRPSVLSKLDFAFPGSIDVFYISDLHIDTHIVEKFPSGATDEQINDYIETIAKGLFTGDFGDSVKTFSSPIVLFGGDVAASFSVADKFYRSFIGEWKHIVDSIYKEVTEASFPIKSELSIISKQIDAWKSKHSWTKRATKPLTEYESVPDGIKTSIVRSCELKDKLRNIEGALGYGWRDRYFGGLLSQYVYAVLGNHEYWSFGSYEKCIAAYKGLFSELNIRFLNSSICDFGPQHKPIKWTAEKAELLNIVDDPDLYDKQMIINCNMVIVGGTGFAAKNQSFNARNLIYNTAISPEREDALTSEWVDIYHHAIEVAKERHSPLIVLSHMPVADWLDGDETPTNTVFFNGHTHDNMYWQDEERNILLFADNQVGYKRKRFVFYKAMLYMAKNPFASLSDGYKEIGLNEYREFNRFMSESIHTTGTIERFINVHGCRFYVIKHQGCYGFFLTSPKAIYICNGGAVKKIGEGEEIKIYSDRFITMVELYLQALSPLRRLQEQLSDIIKSFGGKGLIHGTIVDIDDYNHIMIDPESFKLEFYYAPWYGAVKIYNDLPSLLKAHCPELESSYLACGSPLIPYTSNKTEKTDLIKVNIKNSPYELSRKVAPLQKLFDKHILRAWDNDVLEYYLTDNNAIDTIATTPVRVSIESVESSFDILKEKVWVTNRQITQATLFALIEHYLNTYAKKLQKIEASGSLFKFVISCCFKHAHDEYEIECRPSAVGSLYWRMLKYKTIHPKGIRIELYKGGIKKNNTYILHILLNGDPKKTLINTNQIHDVIAAIAEDRDLLSSSYRPILLVSKNDES